MDKAKEKMILISFHIPQPYLEALDELVKAGAYPSRSEAIRSALRELPARYKLDGV
ncbi:ribbon-helix-helix domain-containing protein [Pyrobaculum sp. 3827-6]|uniref:ribbon-helix-helix domain-containing protein n=1 Tax=Pyrobaculum sp. 3827-6 TaxID=2983604 RepID=UPI0021DA00D9|nr:ribbon-helix-helix domain-containing protein [Pyrobaculum sp. 3827-6]MCU7788350.1 ribbon-helix-helix domain-containing protein [Pyrobaculum sp. 3827-6]